MEVRKEGRDRVIGPQEEQGEFQGPGGSHSGSHSE